MAPSIISRIKKGWILWLVSIVALVILLTHFEEESDLINVLSRVHWYWIFLAILFEFLTHICVSFLWKTILLSRKIKVPYQNLFKLSLTKLFVEQAFPTLGLSGVLMISKTLKNHNVAESTAAIMISLQVLAHFLAYFIGFLFAFIILFPLISSSSILFYLSLVFLVLIFLLLVGIIYLWVVSTHKRVPKKIYFIKRLEPVFKAFEETPIYLKENLKLISLATVLEMTVFFLDSLTLLVVFKMIGINFSLANSFISFIISSGIGTISFIPGGIGAYEGASTLVLHTLGISFQTAITATLLFRGFTYWLPFLPGFFMSRHELKK